MAKNNLASVDLRNVMLENQAHALSEICYAHRRIERSLPPRYDSSGIFPLGGTLQLLPLLPLDSVWVLPIGQKR